RGEVRGKKQDVVAARGERRQPERDNRKPVIEIRAKSAHLCRRHEILAGRRDEPHVHRLAARAAETANGLLLNDLQELALQSLRQQPDLVQEHDAIVSDLEQTRLRLPGIGEGPPLEPEELSLDQCFRDRGAVHVDERSGMARAGTMNQVGEEPLSRARFALDEDRRQPAGPTCMGHEVIDLLADRHDLTALAEQFIWRVHRDASYTILVGKFPHHWSAARPHTAQLSVFPCRNFGTRLARCEARVRELPSRRQPKATEKDMANEAREKQSRPMGRRYFLGRLGAGAVAASASSGFRVRTAHAQTRSTRFSPIREDRFGRMFPDLNPFFRDNTPSLRAAMRDIGKPGGILDARDQVGDGGKAAANALIMNPALNVNNPNNLVQTAGTTFMGQFIDHDLTFDQTSVLRTETEPAASPNTRNPRFDLDAVYGDGPLVNPELFVSPGDRRERPTKLRIESGGLFEDVPRDRDNIAIIADPRNDENMMISGLQAAFILFHNNAVDLVKHEHRGASSEERYEEANRLTRWHYQWIVLHE